MTRRLPALLLGLALGCSPSPPTGVLPGSPHSRPPTGVLPTATTPPERMPTPSTPAVTPPAPSPAAPSPTHALPAPDTRPRPPTGILPGQGGKLPDGSTDGPVGNVPMESSTISKPAALLNGLAQTIIILGAIALAVVAPLRRRRAKP